MNNPIHQLPHRKGNLITLGIVLSIMTYWLFAQTFLNLGNVLQDTFHTSQSILNLSISLTSLITGIFMVAAGNFSDRFGQKKMAFLGIILSIIGSLLLILTPNAYVMLTGRVIQGFSAALLMPSTISILNLVFEGDRRRSALSWWSIGAFGGTGLASIIGGLVSTYFAWQWIFIISIIFAVIGLVLLLNLRKIELSKATVATPFDFVGLLIFTIVMAALSIFITQGKTLGYFTPVGLTLLAVTIIGAIIFYLVEKKKQYPFIDFSLFSNKAYTGVIAANFLLNMSVGSIAVFNIFIQKSLGLSTFQSGLVTLPYVIMLLLLVRVGEKSIAKYGPKKALVVAPLLLAVGVVLFALTFLTGWTYIIVAAIGFIFFGAGVGLFATPALDTAVSTLPKEKTGIASAIFKMASTLGSGFGIAILVALYSMLAPSMGASKAAMIAFIINIVIAVIAFLFSKVFIPKSLDKPKA
ncbi:MFS transporter [Macrococcus hajekii]|uniref:Quinolone resistance protein NorB n=1 Tax=Macrococcus hajekii TaxID=198482 RepID=A0A4R6BJ88_9STAP|nr:MFS transporter [Macrococcus hajekii]TDM01755.1 MFS transporter [Macrococcus hajekii]GGB07156.1 MFS transporter [Macrococcus hajekii]